MTDDQAIAAVDNILMDKAESNKLPEKVEYDMPNSELTQLKAINDDPQQLEGFIMEDNGIPLNMRLVQTKSDDDMEYMTMDDVPFNAKLVHIGDPEEGELVMLDQGQKWGFLKNIVNIDRFFDSGVRA